jgi:hypothetical protein
MICGHCGNKHDAVRDVARCAWEAHAKTEAGVSPAFKKAMEKRFPASKTEVKA